MFNLICWHVFGHVCNSPWCSTSDIWRYNNKNIRKHTLLSRKLRIKFYALTFSHFQSLSLSRSLYDPTAHPHLSLLPHPPSLITEMRLPAALLHIICHPVSCLNLNEMWVLLSGVRQQNKSLSCFSTNKKISCRNSI